MRRGLLEHPIAAPPSAEALLVALDAAHPGAAGLVWLDSGEGATRGTSLVALGEPVLFDPDAPVLPQLRATLDALAAPPHGGAAGRQPAGPLGLIGWFGYELRAETMQMPAPAVAPEHRAAWLLVDRGVLFDHATGEARLIALDPSGRGWQGELAAWRQRMLALAARASDASPPPVAEPPALGPLVDRDDDAHYARMVARCQEFIREGEAYQLCLTTQTAVETLDGSPLDAVALYRRLRRGSPAHHGALLRVDGVSLLSASPETFLRVADGIVQTRPIKGTRPRSPEPERDAALAAELAANDKEQAENLMIVDLMRNDLARVSEVGSVVVTGLHEVESYAHVHQLVSTVEGRLREGLDALDAVAACFPAGSMTGAPKRRAIELLDGGVKSGGDGRGGVGHGGLERGPRGIYSGAFGYLGLDGGADLAMVIRSIVVEGGRATVGAGGGVTALSVPAAEVAEMRLKAAALLRALGVEREESGRGPR
ncbi:anthranilate synthase component I family protein [Microcella frigidaquae]|uniref:Anthranilate synthase component 1 n=1 Tax=Microcella frigidaquae TaxID=424758 RepID=A0A840X8P4_9MICO|nr:anthranilate synthase component I family protein [Microcella frigidaquae]MBB5618963.1 anthranilate synthase component 1 [Microcella frigidaquae]NHN44885.1 anthranilate synthase component I family protein [Microcella frigidaquae]